MKRLSFTATLLLTAFSAFAARTEFKLEKGWRFTREDHAEAVRPDFDDSAWQRVTVPHDWAIYGPFDIGNDPQFVAIEQDGETVPSLKAGRTGGLPVVGPGWYRIRFDVPDFAAGKRADILFDGAMSNARVYLNGEEIGYWPYGYGSFQLDATRLLKPEGNVLAVRLENYPESSRWYPGAGLYRNVHVIVSDEIRIPLWGIRLTTPEIRPGHAKVRLQADVESPAGVDSRLVLKTLLRDAGGRVVAKAETTLAEYDAGTFCQNLVIDSPRLWSPDTPDLYEAELRLYADGELRDTRSVPFGVRELKIVPDRGMFLNGEPIKFRGVCLHHDLGPLGAAVNVSALRRQLSILKEMGANAVRTSHNPPAPELLDICDRIGLLVQDEAFDMWRKRKSPYDYAQYFDEWHEKDLTDQILRDRNHPSVFMWSIGNEVLEQWQHADADTLSLEAANLILNAGHPVDDKILSDTAMSVQGLIAHSLAAIVKRLDKTRPVTAANNEATPGNLIFRSNALDVLGFNYHEKNYEPFPQNFPGKTLIVSESTSALMTRGYYQMPSDSMYVWPNTWRERFDRPEHLCSAYDNCHVPWGSTHEVTWREVKRLPYVSGLFIWTGFDYLGEPTPYWWPSRSSFFGIVDLAGIPKDVYYMYQSEWTDTPVLHLFPHWNWKKGETVDIWAYYNQADEVELFLNGESLGVKSKPDDAFHVCWRVPFTPGTLKAVSRKDGKEVLAREIRTAGEPARIMLIPDRSALHADGTDLSFVTVEIQDKDGNLVPDADNLLRFTVEGDGFIAGTDNGDQNDPVSLKKPERHAFYGKAMAVVQNTGKAGTIRLKATAEGLPDAIVEIKVGE